jgi:hypothetical protein
MTLASSSANPYPITSKLSKNVFDEKSFNKLKNFVILGNNNDYA